MTKAMPFLQKAILLSYDPRPFVRGLFYVQHKKQRAPDHVRGAVLREEFLFYLITRQGRCCFWSAPTAGGQSQGRPVC